MIDPLIAVYNRILEKYLADKLKETERIAFLTELRRIQYAVSNGNLELDEVRDYLKNLLDALFGEDLIEDDKNKIIDEFMKVFKVEIYRTKSLVPRRRFM